ncbi:PRC-barrel domain-containing protein [Halovibrio sp. HP20-50]|uniref:PRC-barrel domain-containing protein n=1 Tax=Halovibrio sp. HP20-59 TaxID=3080275 RepID=UPI00294AED7B|nr:PRC-barrel domain-containing protein [Halovibrio sp. HP20-59]MEA2117813.1 PRC-barrel domain-containing protein [Halovibrio sp. HP20-59]
MPIKRNVCVTTLAVTATTIAVQASAQQTPAVGEVISPLSDWNYEEIYEQGGIRADNLMGAEVFGENEEEIGNVANALITQNNTISAIIAEVGGFWDIGDTHVLVPWDEVELHEDGVSVPVTEENVEDYGLFASDEYITQEDLSQPQRVEEGIEAGEGGWKLTELLNDYATVGGGVGYGYINNILFSREGEVQAVIVATGAGFGSGTYAYPFYGYGYGWSPGQTSYPLQYNENEVGEMEAFDYDRYDGLLDD